MARKPASPRKSAPAAQTVARPRVHPPLGRVDWAIFATLFVAYAWFFQGGGWNQNGRFAQVRAIVEQGRCSFNDFYFYLPTAGADGDVILKRVNWDEIGNYPRNQLVFCTMDYCQPPSRLMYPNKPPGTSFLGVPAYAVINTIERIFGVDRDDWWTMTFNAWWTTVFSVGLLTALSGVAFYRASRLLFADVPIRWHAAAALCYGLATLMWPFATVFFDHTLVAALLLMAFQQMLAAQPADDSGRWSAGRLALAGLLSGWAVVTNYPSVLIVAMLGLYLLVVSRRPAALVAFAAGGLLPAIVLASYHQVCFGSISANANTYQPKEFMESQRWLGMFGVPDLPNLVRLLFSFYRGVFISSPVLLAAAGGILLMASNRRRLFEAGLLAAVFLAMLMVNSSFNGWEGGYSCGPRYLIPAVPFLALGITPLLARLPALVLPLAGLSFAIMLLCTAVDAQVPKDKMQPIFEYLLPLAGGNDVQYEEHRPRLRGPVSVNPYGVFDGIALYTRMGPDHPQIAWNSFNLGEFVFERSLLSVVPLLLLLAAGVFLVFRWARPPPAGIGQ